MRTNRALAYAALFTLAAACGEPTEPAGPSGPNGDGTSDPNVTVGWDTLPNQPTTEDTRHDDIFLIDEDRGWLVDNGGTIHRTRDGGESWTLLEDRPGVVWRAIGFASESKGWVGVLGDFGDPEPGMALWETTDGGGSWTNISDRVDGPEPVGICGIWVHDADTVYAVGRWVGPAIFLRSYDGGESWESFDLSEHATGLIDVHFFDSRRGIVVGGDGVGATIEEQESSRAVVLMTEDGGESWTPVYEGETEGKWLWKISFPTPSVGYISSQGTTRDGLVLKTTDGGRTWEELTVAEDAAFSGIGFVTPDTGWVAEHEVLYETRDGGATWESFPFGRSINQFRFLSDDTGYAVGRHVYRFHGLDE